MAEAVLIPVDELLALIEAAQTIDQLDAAQQTVQRQEFLRVRTPGENGFALSTMLGFQAAIQKRREEIRDGN